MRIITCGDLESACVIGRATWVRLAISVPMLALAPVVALAYQPIAPARPARARARPAVAVLEAFPEISSTFVPLPEGFMPPLPEAEPHTPFSRHLFNAIMTYIAIDGAIAFAPIISRKFSRTPEADAAKRLAKRLAKVPDTSFGFLQADLRLPLPPLEELHMHPVGRRGSYELYLCRHEHAGRFLTIERSIEFSDHFGTPAPLTHEPAGRPLTQHVHAPQVSRSTSAAWRHPSSLASREDRMHTRLVREAVTPPAQAPNVQRRRSLLWSCTTRAIC